MDNLIKLSSITEAMKAKELLFRNKIYSTVKRIPSTNQSSCSYGLNIKDNTSKAVEILQKNGIKIKGISSGDL